MVEFMTFLANALDRFLSIQIVPGISYYTVILLGFIGVAVGLVVNATHN